MATPLHNAQTLLEKIQSLPTEWIAEVEDFVDFLRGRSAAPQTTTGKELQDFPVDDLGPWPDGLRMRREDLYGDDER